MRHVAVGRHARYRSRPSGWSYLIVALAAIAAIVASLVFASQSEPAQAQPGANQAPAVTANRGAGSAAADSAVQLARAKTVAARLAAVQVRAAARTAALTYTVRAGDSISSVALKHCGHARDWTGIYAGSRLRHMTARNANVLTAGQHLWLSCSYDPDQLGFAPKPRPVYHAVRYHGTLRHSYRHHRVYRSYSSGTYRGSGSMQRCIIARESGGNSQVMNSSGHYGLYQFSESTWIASGGSASTFGHASVAEQNRVFYNAVAARGYSDWTPYDGC